jgi:transcriptional regulator with XRE-family HTH domain
MATIKDVARLAGVSVSTISKYLNGGNVLEENAEAIRNAIELAWQRRDERIWRMYFAPAPDGSIPRPTNGQLLHTLMRQISGLQKDEKIG